MNYEMEYILDAPTYEGSYAHPPTSPPYMDECSPNLTQFVSSIPSRGKSTSRGLKHKGPMVDLLYSQFDKLGTKLDDFMDVMGLDNS